MTREEVLMESAKCIKDTPYCLRTYLQTYDNTVKKFVPLDLFADQVTLVNDYENYNENIALKYRQAGVSTVTAAWASKRLVFANRKTPEKILIIANKLDTAVEMANKIRSFTEQWPKWVGVSFAPEKNAARHFKLTNGCEVKAVATSKDALRGYTPTMLIFDEAAYIEADADFWAACIASLSCVHESSYIFTDNGIIQLKDIIQEKEKTGFSNYDGDIKIINKDGEVTEINRTFKSIRTKSYKIKTRFGYELIGSYKHPLLVWNDGAEDWVKMEDLKLGDRIKFQYNQNLFGKDQEIKFDLNNPREQNKYTIPSKLSDDLDLCYLMGLFVAEGNYNGNTIAITNGDEEIIDFLKNIGFKESRKHHFYFCSSYLMRFFKEYMGIEQVKAKDKKIPSLILRSSKDVVKAFLQGLFDGDGCAFDRGIKYTTTSKELATQLQILLLNFGIQSFVKYSEQKTSQTSIISNKNHITKIYELFIKKEYAEKFFNEIGFRLTRKQERITYHINKLKNRQTIYATKDELKAILKENNISRTQYENEFRCLDGLMRKNKTVISVYTFEKLIAKNLKDKTTLSIWQERYDAIKNYFYDEITHIESFEEDTYDLEIPNGHSFITNGIISHNTGGKILVISTPNGYDRIYYEIYDQALRGMNEFKITEMFWYRDPRYTKDLYMVKTNDIIHFLLNREDYSQDLIIDLSHINSYDRDKKMIDEYIENGYQPCSSWFEGMVRKLKYDRRKVSQEIEGRFLGSGDNVFEAEILRNISRNMLREPSAKLMGNALWVFKEPENGHRYVLGCLTPHEKVMTDNGLKNIIDVTLNDKLINENGDIVNIINKQIYNVENEDTFEIKVDNTYRTTTFTKEHPILISKPILKRNYQKNNERYWDFDFKYTKVSEITVGDWIKVPNIYKKKIEIDFDEKWMNTDVRKDFKIDSPLSNVNFWWFIGVWLGDGWIQNNNLSYSIHVCFNKNEKYYFDKTLKIIKELFNRDAVVVEKDSTYEIFFNSKELHCFILDNFGQYSHGKKIPEWVKYLGEEYKLNLIKGYFDSDGCWVKTNKRNQNNSKISFVSINLELLESFQDILFSLGIISSLNKLRDEKTQIICGKLSNCKKCYNLSLAHYDSLFLIKLLNDKEDIKLNKFDLNDFEVKNKRIISSCHLSKDENWIYFKVKSIKKSRYTGKVYNFECDTNTFMCHHITTHNCDVSRGDSEDFSCIEIIDFDTQEQVFEYVGKVPPDVLAEIAFKWGMMYKAFIVVDLTGGMGVATSRKLQEMGYTNIYYDNIDPTHKWKYDPKSSDKIPGLNFNNKRVQIISSFEVALRHNFKVYSSRLYNEMNTFIYINGRPDHQKGHHDDCIMAISMALFVAEKSFQSLEKVTNHTKAMVNSWQAHSNEFTERADYFNPVIPKYDARQTKVFQNNPTMNEYMKYSWLFGKR